MSKTAYENLKKALSTDRSVIWASVFYWIDAIIFSPYLPNTKKEGALSGR